MTKLSDAIAWEAQFVPITEYDQDMLEALREAAHVVEMLRRVLDRGCTIHQHFKSYRILFNSDIVGESNTIPEALRAALEKIGGR